MPFIDTFSYRCLYLHFVQCNIVNFHFGDFSFKIWITDTCNPHSNFVAFSRNLITCRNVYRDTYMSIDIQRDISATRIVSCCNMSPHSCCENLSSWYFRYQTIASVDDYIEEFVFVNPYKDSIIVSSVAEQWSVLASGLNPAHQSDCETSVQTPIIRKLDVAGKGAKKHVRSSWFVVGSFCYRNIPQDSLWLPVVFFSCSIACI